LQAARQVKDVVRLTEGTAWRSLPCGGGMLRALWSVLWEQPQTVLGALVLLQRWAFGLVEHIELRDGRILTQTRGGISLGLFVFCDGRGNRWFYPGSGIREHEYGHTFQSCWFGPLYLLVVGVPSLSRGIYAIAYRELTGRRWRGYFDGWPEKQADRLGKVDRQQIQADWPSC
jgi:hypothetical protein